MNMFEKATRLKPPLRFNYRGQATVEDLWDIPVSIVNGNYTSLLNDIFCELDAIKEQRRGGLFATKTGKDEILDLKLAIVKHIVEVKVSELQERLNANLKAERKQKLLGMLSAKQDANMSVEDLTKEIDEL